MREQSAKQAFLDCIESALGQIRLVQMVVRNNNFAVLKQKYPSPLVGLSQVVMRVTALSEQHVSETLFAHALVVYNERERQEGRAPLIPGDFRTVLFDPLPLFTQMASNVTPPPTLSELGIAEQYCIRLSKIIRGIDEKCIH